MDTSTYVTNEQEQYDNATSHVVTHGCPSILSNHTETSYTVTLQHESTQISEAINDDQPSRIDFEAPRDLVQNTACSNNIEWDKVKDSCSSTNNHYC